MTYVVWVVYLFNCVFNINKGFRTDVLMLACSRFLRAHAHVKISKNIIHSYMNDCNLLIISFLDCV